MVGYVWIERHVSLAEVKGREKGARENNVRTPMILFLLTHSLIRGKTKNSSGLFRVRYGDGKLLWNACWDMCVGVKNLEQGSALHYKNFDSTSEPPLDAGACLTNTHTRRTRVCWEINGFFVAPPEG